MSHRSAPSIPARSSRPQPATKSGSVSKSSEQSTTTTTILAAPKPVRPISAKLQPPAAQWTENTSPSSYTSFNVPPPGSPAPNPGGPSAPPRMPVSSPGSSAANRLAHLRSPGPGAITSFPPPPPTPPQIEAINNLPRGAAPLPKKPSASATTTTTAPRAQSQCCKRCLDPAGNPRRALWKRPGPSRQPGVIDFDNLEQTLKNLRFAPSPMLSTIYSVPSTPGDEMSTPDFPIGHHHHHRSCFTPPSTNPTPEPLTPVDATPRGPPPVIKEPVVSPTRPRANSRRASPPSRKRGRGVVACINSPATLCTTWYTHPTAPHFSICSRCYEDHLVGTRFEHDFRGKVCDDDKPRVCRFSKPRIRDHILRSTLATGRIEDLVSFLGRRSAIPDCRGADGVVGSQGPRWYRPKNNAVPNMVVCQACFEDHIQPYRFAANFEAASGQAPADVWSCDLSTPRIQKAYRAAAAGDDWAAFTREAVARMAMPACARGQRVTVGSRRWFTPAAAAAAAVAAGRHHDGVLVCEACYHDHVVGSGKEEERKWRDAGGDLASRYGSLVYCALGHFNVGVAMSRAAETGDPSVFWRALDATRGEEFCGPQGIRDGTWYTFPSHPEEFAICASCVATVAEPLGLASSLVTKCGVAPGATTLCSFNPASPRFAAYMGKLLEGFFTADTQPLESYALEFASLPLCPRDEDLPNRRWYGWRDCAVCPSCYHEFARGTALAASMPLKGDMVAASLMCEMYSPRMRALYAEACARSPPDASELLAACRARRAVYAETVPAIREIIMEAQAARGHRRVLSGGGGGGAVGQIQDVAARQIPGVRSVPGGAGFGITNHFDTQSTLYGNSILAESGTRALVIKQLERKWREVE